MKDTPIYNAMKKYAHSGVIPFHVPGHKRGNLYKKLNIEMGNLLALDTTEVPGIDNLHTPEDSIKEAQELAAKAFGADQTFFLVNGTTCGIYSMILAVTEPGDSIILPRNCHKSVMGAAILGRLKPIYIMPGIDEEMGIGVAIRALDIEEALNKNPNVKAVVITNPTYYGTCSDIVKIAEVVHKHEKVLLVDEAHGAHFMFHEKLPISAMEAGADMAAQSTHKTLASLTGSSMLHVKSKNVNLEKLKFFLSLTQTTSPSHLMLATLDISREIAENYGNELIHDIIDLSSTTRKVINSIKGLYCLDESKIGYYGIKEIDVTRLTISAKGLGITGTDLDRILREKYNIQVEFSDTQNIIAVSTIGDGREYFDKLITALKNIANDTTLHKNYKLQDAIGVQKTIPKSELLPYEAIYSNFEEVKIEDSLNRISLEMLSPYPPGIPIILPGEVINQEVLNIISNCRLNGIKINGTKDSKAGIIRVKK